MDVNHRIPALDGIRAIAILLVFAVHTSPSLLEGGRIGVDLFFVLSGFLITSILLGEQRKTGAINLFNFYMRRLLRLFPAVVLMTTVVVTYAFIMQPHSQFPRTLWNAIGVLLYFFNWQLVTVADLYDHQWMFSHVWSLSVEEQFYIIWPTILIATFAWGSNRTRFAVAIAGIIVSAGARAIAWKHHPALVVYFNTFYRFDGLMWGAFAAMLIDVKAIPEGAALRKAVSWSSVVAFAGLLIIAWPEGLVNGFLYLIGFSLVNLCSAILIFSSVTSPSEALMPLLTWRPLCWIGKISYGLYLWHWPIIRAVPDLFPTAGPTTKMLIEFPATFIIATLSFYLIEQRFLRMKENFSPEAKSSPPLLRGEADVLF